MTRAIVILAVVFALELVGIFSSYSTAAPSVYSRPSPYECLVLSPYGWLPCRDLEDLQLDA